MGASCSNALLPEFYKFSNSPSVNGSTKRKRPPGYATSSSSQGPSRAKTPEIIALDSETSDSEGEVVEQLTSPPPKRTKQDYGDDDLKYDLHSDEDEDNRFPSPTVEHIIWKPVPVKVHSPKFEQIDDDSVPSTPVTPRQPKRRTDRSSLITRWQEPVANNNDMIGNFDRLRSSCSIRNRNALCSLDWRSTTSKGIGSMTMSKTSSFKQSPGSIMCIIQKQDWVVVCSICEGDHPDQPDEGPISPYNRDGSLIAWNQEQTDVMTGHRRRVDGADERWKYYSVNDIKFDPTSTSFVSSGGDKKVRSWQIEPDSNEYVLDRVINFQHKYTHVPHALAFKPGTRKLAVAEKKIHVYEDYDNSLAHRAFNVVPYGQEHTVGDMLWGCHSTDGLIFASSEPDDVDRFEGFHRAIDVETRKCYELDSNEAGDSIALTYDGDLLVHTSRGPGGKHPLRLYDVRRKDWRAIKTVHMEGFQPNIRGEVNSIAISPDGIYIALGRIDNRVHVYDARMPAKGVLYEFEHTGNNLTSPGRPLCGIVRVQWAETEFSRLTLVSGGMDGCVRLWDPLQAITSPTNGVILAQANSDIGDFALGDCTGKEQQLVVGDCSGEVSMFNGSRTYIRPL